MLANKKKTVCVSAVLRLVYHCVREWGRGEGEGGGGEGGVGEGDRGGGVAVLVINN